MEEEGSGPQRAPRYPAEDTSLTSKRELMGWYAYGLAAEVFAVCGVGSFLPVTLEQLARENGVLFSDRTISCVAPKSSGGSGSSYAVKMFARAAQDKNSQCVIQLLGHDITTSSLAMYTFSVSVLVQSLVLVSFSSVADHGTYRKKLLLFFAFTGSTASMLFLLVVPDIYFFGCMLVVVGVACLGSSFVLLNSFLPLLVLNHPQVQGESPAIAMQVRSPGLRTPTLESDNIEIIATTPIKPGFEVDSTELQISSAISAKGVGIGYAAAVFVQILSIILLFVMSKTDAAKLSPSLPLRLVLFCVGLWWFVFSIPTYLWLRDRPGPPLHASMAGRAITLKSSLAYVSFAWMSLFRTIRVAIKLRQVVIFLMAWFLLSDAVATVSATAILFARTELGMSTVQVAILSITATSSGIVGAYTWPKISLRYSLKTNNTIVACICLMEIIPLYGLLGFLPFVQSWGVGGLQQPWEIFPLGVVHGFVMGGLSSYCRSFYGRLIPPGSEAAFYALYAITDKGSSAVGPAVVGAIVDVTGTIRPAFAFLAVLIAIPAPLIYMINVESGQDDAAKMARTMKATGGETDARSEDAFHHEQSEGLLADHN
ncbi:autophagy-related protein [Coleophoma cylindrospora]|uniref:Autophagy-related protein n=1 Tax=Coleophoma cylindrospora TaxID=1849047 RepID=A0A3D8SQN2_9HELO|nr:autophagy-related protein [Coleophoma cylindrospora]